MCFVVLLISVLCFRKELYLLPPTHTAERWYERWGWERPDQTPKMTGYAPVKYKASLRVALKRAALHHSAWFLYQCVEYGRGTPHCLPPHELRHDLLKGKAEFCPTCIYWSYSYILPDHQELI